jgi:hypothetical protein
MTFKAVFPDIGVRDRSGHDLPTIGRPEAFEPVSGRNILILPEDTSLLEAVEVDSRRPVVAFTESGI